MPKPKAKKRKRKNPEKKATPGGAVYYQHVIQNEDGTETILPPLVEAVMEMELYRSRGYIVQVLTKRYSCSTMTIDRAIAAAKDASDDELSMDRADRIRKNYQRLISNARKANAAGQHAAVTGSIREASTLASDRRPDVVLIPGADLDSAALEAEVRRLLDLAARHKGT